MNKITTTEKQKATKINVSKKLRSAKSAELNGQYVEAKDIYHEILDVYPQNARAKAALKVLVEKNPIPDLTRLVNEGRYKEIEEILLSNIERDHNNPHFWRLLAIAYKEMENHSLALQCYDKAVALNPNDLELIFEIGCHLLKIDDLSNAYKTFRHILSISPESSGAHTNIGEIYYRIRKHDKAAQHWKTAIDIDPSENIALTMLGIHAADNNGKFEEALDFFEQALKVTPDDVNLYVNIATVYCETGQPQKALEIFESWAQRNWDGIEDSKQHQFNFNYSLALFNAGKLEEAWRLYQKRIDMGISTHTKVTDLEIPRLETLSDAIGKKVILLREQGVGDQIFFLGLLNKFLKESNCEIILQTEDRLVSLLQRAFPSCQITTKTDLNELDIDFWLPYADMGHLLKFYSPEQSLSTPYLKADKDKIRFWDKRLCKDKIRVGFAWRSGLLNPRRMRNYTYLSDWTEIIQDSRFQLICLQYGDILEDLDELDDELKSKIYIPDIDLKNDFDDISAVMANCHAVFGPFGAPVWQSSALGVKTVVCNLHGYDNFSFGRAQSESGEYQNPWYANCSHVMFRQSDKKSLVRKVKKVLLHA